jgi:hypothetical protein
MQLARQHRRQDRDVPLNRSLTVVFKVNFQSVLEIHSPLFVIAPNKDSIRDLILWKSFCPK